MTNASPASGSTRLILRLSSLGDLILSTSALQALPKEQKIDWVIAKEWTELLQGHEKISQLISFDRKLGLLGWIELSHKLWQSKYEEVLDLHNTLRTRILRICFLFWALRDMRRPPRWKTISKQRVRLVGFFWAKRLWPRQWRPTPYVERFARMSGGTGKERPSLAHLGRNSQTLQHFQDEAPLSKNGYICVMPSSRWEGKNWSVENYLEVLKKAPFPVILGTSSDSESLGLVELLLKQQIPHFSGIGKWGFDELATILKNAQGYLGGDTGLAHFAEAMNTPATIIYGPTVPEMGFGPWRKQSHSIGSSLWCRPCSKDGRGCFRLKGRYLCMKVLRPEAVQLKYK